MNKILTVKASKNIASTPERIWEVLTKPENIKKFLYDTNTTCTWEIGSEIIFEGTYNGIDYRDKGIIISFKPYELIEYSYWSSFNGTEDVPENYALIRYKLEQMERHVILHIEQVGFVSEEMQEHSRVSWNNILDSIEKLSVEL